MSLELREELEKLREKSGLSLADILKVGLEKLTQTLTKLGLPGGQGEISGIGRLRPVPADSDPHCRKEDERDGQRKNHFLVQPSFSVRSLRRIPD